MVCPIYVNSRGDLHIPQSNFGVRKLCLRQKQDFWIPKFISLIYKFRQGVNPSQ